jgi:hypothetical protein
MSSVPVHVVTSDRGSGYALAEKPDGNPAAVSEFHPGKWLLVGVGIVCAALVVLLIVEGPGY